MVIANEVIKAFMTKIERKTQEIDAAGVVLGRLASRIAILLMGKHKVDWQPNCDCGDNVHVINASKIRLTGKKMEQKEYKSFSGYPGGMKTRLAKDVFSRDPAWMIKKAVTMMLPKNKLQSVRIKRLTVTK